MDPRVTMIEELFLRFNEGDREPRESELAPGVEIWSPLTEFRGRPFVGYEGVRDWFRELDELFDEWSAELTELRMVGERAAARGMLHMRGRASGVSIDQEFGWVIHFAGGRVTRFHILADPTELERVVAGD